MAENEQALPTRKLQIIDNSKALDEIQAFAKQLESEGERPWFEVWYAKPDHIEMSEEEWQIRQGLRFDAVEVKNGEVSTLRPYAELVGS